MFLYLFKVVAKVSQLIFTLTFIFMIKSSKTIPLVVVVVFIGKSFPISVYIQKVFCGQRSNWLTSELRFGEGK